MIFTFCSSSYFGNCDEAGLLSSGHVPVSTIELHNLVKTLINSSLFSVKSSAESLSMLAAFPFCLIASSTSDVSIDNVTSGSELL